MPNLYLEIMPVLNVQFSDEEMVELRAAAEREGKALKVLAHDLVISAVVSRKYLVSEAATRVARISGELNDRLA